MRTGIHRLKRRARALTLFISAGAVFQTGGCSVQLTDAFLDLGTTILGQLITSYVNDQLNVATGF